MARHTVTHEILAIYKMGEPKPDLSRPDLQTETQPR
jgi:hypothetical protein